MNKIKPVVIAWTIAALWLIAIFVVISALSNGSALATYLVTWGTTSTSTSTTSTTTSTTSTTSTTTTTTTTTCGVCVLEEKVFDESGCVCDSNSCVADGQISHMYFCSGGDCACGCGVTMGTQLGAEIPLCIGPASCDETSDCSIWGWHLMYGDAPASCPCEP